MKSLIKRYFDTLVQAHWLRILDKEIRKYKKLETKLQVQAIVIRDLTDEYKKRYNSK